MRKTLLAILLVLTLVGCKKEVPAPQITPTPQASQPSGPAPPEAPRVYIDTTYKLPTGGGGAGTSR